MFTWPIPMEVNFSFLFTVEGNWPGGMWCLFSVTSFRASFLLSIPTQVSTRCNTPPFPGKKRQVALHLFPQVLLSIPSSIINSGSMTVWNPPSQFEILVILSELEQSNYAYENHTAEQNKMDCSLHIVDSRTEFLGILRSFGNLFNFSEPQFSQF